MASGKWQQGYFRKGVAFTSMAPARGDAREDSDWDLLLLLDKPKLESEDFDKYTYPIMVNGFDQWQLFSVQTYTKDQWFNGPHAMYYYNVENEKNYFMSLKEEERALVVSMEMEKSRRFCRDFFVLYFCFFKTYSYL